MTEQAEQPIHAEAIEWHLRLRDGNAADWEAFVRWLEADPARSTAYDEVARADADLGPELFPSAAANDDWAADTPAPRRFGAAAWAVAAVAACLLLALLALPWLNAAPDRYEVATAAGQRRTVPLGDGSAAALNGATRLILDRANPRYAELAAGEATFTIRHDGADPFVVVAGDHRLQDVGTIFNIARDGGTLTVEVIEGAVRYSRREAEISLTAGQILAVREGGGRPLLGRRDPAVMAGWRRGQLSYRDASLESVARDLTRSLGAQVSIDPGVATLPFTGSVRVAGGAETVLTGFAATLGMEARRDGNAWRIGPRSRARR
jgi:transmembrane sensor